MIVEEFEEIGIYDTSQDYTSSKILEKTRQLSEVHDALEIQKVEFARKIGAFERREEALHKCVKGLKSDHRKIIEMRYRDEASIQKISQHADKSEHAIYQMLFRIRKRLYNCIEKKLDTSGTQR